MRSESRTANDELLPALILPVAERDHHINSPGAKFTLVEYGDFECPNCGRAYYVVKELLRELGEDLCYAFRHFPQPEIHPNAQRAAEAAEAADVHGKFWLMHDRLFEHQCDLSALSIRKLAKEIALDLHHFEQDLASGGPARRVTEDRDEALEVGVEDTPTFFVNGRMHVGSYEFRPLLDALKAARASEA